MPIGYWITIILLVLTGVLACAGMIAAKKPNAAVAIGKLVPFQGIIGIIALVWGVWSLIDWITGGGIDLLSILPVLSIVLLIAAVLMILLGVLFGWSLISKLSGKADGGAGLAKIASTQGPLGIAAIIDAIVLLVIGVGRIAI